MTSPINPAAADAREQARATSGEFGNQAHDESGIIPDEICFFCNRAAAVCAAHPCAVACVNQNNPPSIDIDAAVDQVLTSLRKATGYDYEEGDDAEAEDYLEEVFSDFAGDEVTQIRQVSGAIQVNGAPLYAEAAYDGDDGLVGFDIGFKDEAHGCMVIHYANLTDLSSLEPNMGRARVEGLIRYLVKNYDAVHDSYFPRVHAPAEV